MVSSSIPPEPAPKDWGLYRGWHSAVVGGITIICLCCGDAQIMIVYFCRERGEKL